MANDRHTADPTESDHWTPLISRRRLLCAGGLALTIGLAGCADSANSVQTGANGTTPSETSGAQQATAPPPSETQANTPTRTATPVAREDDIWLLGFNYTQPSREMLATVYNPTSRTQSYDIRFYCFNSDGYVVYFTTIESEASSSPGNSEDYRATVPSYVTDQVQYYSVSYRPDDYTDFSWLQSLPSDPPEPASPFYNDTVANPTQYANATVASFTETDSYSSELITRVQNTHSETLFIKYEATLASSGGITLDSDIGAVFPLRPQQTARFVSAVRPSGYQLSDVETASARVTDATVMRLPPSTDIFEIVGRDTIDGELQVELRNTADVPVGAFGVMRWLRGGDLIDVDLASSGNSYSLMEAEDIDPGQRSTLNFGNDVRQGDDAYRATDYNLTLLTNNTLLASYGNEDSGETYIDITAPFSTDVT